MPSPLVSIITPSFNQGQFIEETLKSVASQTYRHYEHIIIDGGSTDETVKILKKYKAKYPDKIKWLSEKDKGQSDAINKGLKMAKGEILTWLNSDDYFFPDTLEKVVNFFNQNKKCFWLSGDYVIVNEKGEKIHSFVRWYKKFLRNLPFFPAIYIANFINQPSTFFRKEVIKKIGWLNVKLRYEMDYEYWLRMIRAGYKNFYLDSPFSYFRVHKQSKGGGQFEKQFKEEIEVQKNFCNNNLINLIHLLHTKIIIFIYKLIK